ncbi:NADH dehydrogenase [ubiquinone] 1 alpha subcomplex assembly factor 3 isoform X2 [Rhinolophus sinicus]|uniref:NADH dehydrogenase [ubiquinone] 1 alpha subcomplex assembly factor 3 isoform X2 n=1 Tax=Rhinolophus sinicus TaxID=89399 RepID=UPI003D7A6B34
MEDLGPPSLTSTTPGSGDGHRPGSQTSTPVNSSMKAHLREGRRPERSSERDSSHTMYIDSYSSRGFVVNGNRVFGPCALLPHSVVQWNVGSHQDITEESFSLFWMLEPRIEIVVVGTGDRTERLQSQVLRAMRQRGIAVEVQDTPNACATFNFLCHEGRVTGAALIPPPGGTVLTSLAQAAA